MNDREKALRELAAEAERKRRDLDRWQADEHDKERREADRRAARGERMRANIAALTAVASSKELEGRRTVVAHYFKVGSYSHFLVFTGTVVEWSCNYPSQKSVVLCERSSLDEVAAIVPDSYAAHPLIDEVWDQDRVWRAIAVQAASSRPTKVASLVPLLYGTFAFVCGGAFLGSSLDSIYREFARDGGYGSAAALASDRIDFLEDTECGRGCAEGFKGGALLGLAMGMAWRIAQRKD